ncbi:acetyltransferase [Alteromonas pelagimontana]|uniref:Acetyltransferase n=1 Tax=Alteromonas pelagimontana TaxID=1858656 RepID=A0A6M4MFB2_9ALTE|nr:acetyltransferase [Alteromonas pelagimontana]QJR81844.1 acetyltransferase [Alteromonas pelagimontana]
MKKKLVIFGAGDIAQLAHYYFSTDSEYEVAAFTVDAEFIIEEQLFKLPIVPFEDLEHYYPPNEFSIFCALSYSKVNQLRKEKYENLLCRGYTFASYISTRATILNDGKIGQNCFILENNVIQPFVEIGNNVTLWSGNHIGHHSVIGDHCFLASHVVVSGGVQIAEQCFIGVNATLRDHISVGARTVIGAGALILRSTDGESVFKGSQTLPSALKSSSLNKI